MVAPFTVKDGQKAEASSEFDVRDLQVCTCTCMTLRMERVTRCTEYFGRARGM